MKSTIISLVTLGLVLTFAPSASKAQSSPNPPGQISYQGFLTDANGLPLATNNPVNYNVQFNIYNVSTGGTPLWGELQIVTVDRGYFTVLLGNGSSIGYPHNLAGIFSGSDASDRYLEMTVLGLGADTPIQPRLRLLTTPYSFMAGSALMASNAVVANSALVASNAVVANSALVANKALSVPDNALSANVALRAGGNTFTGDQKITGGTIFVDPLKGIQGINGAFFPDQGGDFTLLKYGTGGLQIYNSLNQGVMDILNNGNVGIGIGNPAVPLDVFGSSQLNQPSYGYLNGSGQAGPFNVTGPNLINVSIRAAHRIIAEEFDAVSDRRIKDIIGQSDRQADLEVIQKLRVTDFRMKDRVAHGDTLCKGFIAQEVETVIPEAVTKSRQFVPDIYATASGAKFDPAAKTVDVKLAKAHGLTTGDRVRLMTEAGLIDLTVSSVPTEQEFVAANCEKDPKQVFVFGREVSDFRTLNYDRIFTTGISAMQELARRVTALEAHEAERVALEKRAAGMDELEREVSDLKAVVARLAERKEHQASARGVSEQPATSEPSGALVAVDNAGAATGQPSQ